MIAHMQNMKYLHARACHQNWVRMAEPQATGRWHKKYTHVWVRLASFPGSHDSERNFCWIEFMCVFMHLCTCPVTVVDLASIPGSREGRGEKRARYTLLVHARTFPSYWPQNNLDNFYDHMLVIRIHNQQYFTEYLCTEGKGLGHGHTVTYHPGI